MQKVKYSIRAHHGMCLAFFRGKGYSKEFVNNMQAIQDDIKNNPMIRIVAKAEDICAACPNNIKGVCNSEQKVVNYDRKVLYECGLKENSIIHFLDFKELVYDKILSKGKREEICGNCQWNDICHF